ncbi:fungal-specific transcription factor domain-containing protein [Aspergillus karnatakaensis]|uniref:putative C6 transcription factor Prf n=1 Tax=Aspergillus karnatakaensis TaxID=1810916 RepID=UPI003CCD4173
MAGYLDNQNQPQINHDFASFQPGQIKPDHQFPQAATSPGNGDSSSIPRPKRIACAVCRRRKLRCDGRKPSCGTCSRLGHGCTYDEARKKSGPKRGYVKQLEARLAQVETLLKTQEPGVPQAQVSSFPVSLPNEPTGAELHAIGNSMNNSISPVENPSATGPSSSFTPEGVDAANNFGWDMISLGLEEPLPAREVVNELNQIYFEKTHNFVPVIHRPRFMAAMDFAPNSRPPACLQYIVWCHAAATSEKYSNLHSLFYQRARKYAELDQMKGLGESVLTLAHCQTWLLIGCYEYKMMFFPRAWLSTGVAARLAVMLGLHRLDGDGLEVKQCLPPPRDWTEKEERRRVFWMTFSIDRYASIGTGWPTCIDERDIMTNLPSSEEAFINGKPEKTARLGDVLLGEELSTLSPFASVAFVSCLLGRNLTHLHRPEPQDNDSDLNGVFWQRHRSHDNILLHFALSMPSHLRLPAGMADANVLFCNLAVHTSTVCLHQAAIFKAEKNGMPEQIILESKRRCIVAADQISSIMKMVSSMDMSKMNPFISFCVYVAARVFVQYLKFRPDDMAARSSLQFVFAVLDALKNQNPLTESFLVQLEVDIEGTAFQDIRIPSANKVGPKSVFETHGYGETAPHIGTLRRPLNVDKNMDAGCSAWEPKNPNRANLPVCLPSRQRAPTQHSNTATVPPLARTSNLPGFSKAPFIPGENTTGMLFDIEPPSRFHDVTNSAPESSTPSTMNSSSSTSFMRTDRSSSPKQSQPSSRSLSTSVQDPTTFDATNLNQFIDTSNQNNNSNQDSNTTNTSNPLFNMNSIHPSSVTDRTPNMPSAWDFPINVNGDPNDPNAEELDLMTTDMDGFSGAQWAHILGSGGTWNPSPLP